MIRGEVGKSEGVPRNLLASALAMALCLAPIAAAAQDPGAAKPAGDSNQDLAETARKLSNPASDVWALFTEFDLTFNGGTASHGIEDEFAFSMTFQPIMPIKLTDTWKMITRPTLPIIFTAPVPTAGASGDIDFDRRIGLGDLSLPLMPSRNKPFKVGSFDLVTALGPAFVFPTSTVDAFGNQQWEIGPAGLLVMKKKEYMFGIFPQYWWGYADRGGSPRQASSHGEILYFFWYNLPGAMQVGFNPVVTFDHRATRGNKWNVPIELSVTKTVSIGGRPVKFEVGIDYSVVSERFYGKRASIKLNIIPVIPDLIKKPLF